jgi:uncharacterized membrane protein
MKRVLSFLGRHFRAWFAESFTLVGLLIAWIVLPPGSTRSVVGVAIVFAFLVWTLSEVTFDKEDKK